MPIYEYEPESDSCDYCKDGFEALQPFSDPPLSECPQCGKPCHRILSEFTSVRGKASLLSKKNLESHGFTQYKRAGDGCYEKTTGGGPRVIRGK